MPVEVRPPPEVQHRHQPSAMGVTETEPMPVVDSVVRAIQNLTTDANYKLVSDVFAEAMFLRDQNRNLKTAKRELLEEYRSFRNELEGEEKKLKEERDAFERNLEDKEKQILELATTKTRLAEEKDTLQFQVEAKDKELATLTEAKAGFEAERALLETSIVDKEAQIAELNIAKSTLTDDIATLQTALDEKIKELATLSEGKAAVEASLEEKTNKAVQLAEDKNTLAEKVRGLETEVAEKDTELEGLQSDKAALVEAGDGLRSRVSEVEKELASLQDIKAKLESDVAELTESKAKLETDLSGANADIEQQAKNAEGHAKEVSELKVTVDQRIAELSVLRDDLSKMGAAAVEAQARVDTLQSELKDMTVTADEKASRVDALETDVSDLTQRLKETTARVVTLEAELDEVTQKDGEQIIRLETLEGELTGMTATAKDAKARVDFLQTELRVVTAKAEQLQTDLATTTHDLEYKTSRLVELVGYRVSLRSESEDTYVHILDTIWTSIAALVETQFRQDLDHSVLADESCWANLRQSEYLKHARQIPLPQSNSPAAKQMRVAAVLAVLSRALDRYVFRPVYITDNGAGDDGIVNLLRAIACDSATKEEHTRATLLAMLPEKQKAAATKRVSAAVREVSWAVQHLLSALQYETFCNGLEKACKLACVQWMRIQVAQMKIEPYFGPDFQDFDWQVLPLPGFEGQDGGVHLHGDDENQEGAAVVDDTDDVVVEIGCPVDDTPLTPSGGGRVADQEDQRASRSSPQPMTDRNGDSEIGPDEIMLVVWPSMCALEHGQLESITQGLVISKDQVRAALDEVRGRGRQRPATKRARTLSMPGRGVSGSVGKAFLSQGDTEELKDA
ncbi:hypothetical protein GE09DRAFT_1137783 [Coniochaeta sp. 2T2.1]|nr:hypothetical protein GE09DRAFT_1137783 [Coniochaeta sp. 2T2.1]